MDAVELDAPTNGNGITTTFEVVELVQVPLLPTIVYVVFTAGLTVTCDPVMVGEVHVYEVAPEAVKLTDSPLQIVAFGGVTEMTGIGFTIRLTEELGPAQPFIVPNTV